MLDSFLKVAFANEEKVAEQVRLVEKMRALPEDYLRKLASGQEKLAYSSLCGDFGGGGETWLDRFKGTPLFEQALELEKQDLQEQMAEKAHYREEDQARSARNASRDELGIQRKLLELQLAEAEGGGGEPAPEEMGQEGLPPEEEMAPEEAPVEELPEEVPAEEAPPQAMTAPPAEVAPAPPRPSVDVKVASAMMRLSKLAAVMDANMARKALESLNAHKASMASLGANVRHAPGVLPKGALDNIASRVQSQTPGLHPRGGSTSTSPLGLVTKPHGVGSAQGGGESWRHLVGGKVVTASVRKTAVASLIYPAALGGLGYMGYGSGKQQREEGEAKPEWGVGKALGSLIIQPYGAYQIGRSIGWNDGKSPPPEVTAQALATAKQEEQKEPAEKSAAALRRLGFNKLAAMPKGRPMNAYEARERLRGDISGAVDQYGVDPHEVHGAVPMMQDWLRERQGDLQESADQAMEHPVMHRIKGAIPGALSGGLLGGFAGGALSGTGRGAALGGLVGAAGFGALGALGTRSPQSLADEASEYQAAMNAVDLPMALEHEARRRMMMQDAQRELALHNRAIEVAEAGSTKNNTNLHNYNNSNNSSGGGILGATSGALSAGEAKTAEADKAPLSYRAGAAVGRNYDKITATGGGIAGGGAGAALGHRIGGGKGAVIGGLLGASGGALAGRTVGRGTQGVASGMSQAYGSKTAAQFQQVVRNAHIQKTAAASISVMDYRMKLAAAGFTYQQINELEKQAFGALIGKSMQALGRGAQQLGGFMGKARGATARLQQAAGDAPTSLLQRAGGKVEAAGAATNRAGGKMLQQSGTGTQRLERALAAEKAAPVAAKATAPAAAAPVRRAVPPPTPRAAAPAAAGPVTQAPMQAAGQAAKPSLGGFMSGAGKNIQGAYSAGGLAGGARMAKNIAVDSARANPLAAAGIAAGAGLGAGYALS